MTDDFDLIIGRNTIKELDLSMKLADQFQSPEAVEFLRKQVFHFKSEEEAEKADLEEYNHLRNDINMEEQTSELPAPIEKDLETESVQQRNAALVKPIPASILKGIASFDKADLKDPHRQVRFSTEVKEMNLDDSSPEFKVRRDEAPSMTKSPSKAWRRHGTTDGHLIVTGASSGVTKAESEDESQSSLFHNNNDGYSTIERFHMLGAGPPTTSEGGEASIYLHTDHELRDIYSVRPRIEEESPMQRGGHDKNQQVMNALMNDMDSIESSRVQLANGSRDVYSLRSKEQLHQSVANCETANDPKIIAEGSIIAEMVSQSSLEVQYELRVSQLTSREREILSKIQFGGEQEFQYKLKSLCIDFIDVFDTKLHVEAARVPPMEIQVGLDLWERPKNRLGARPQPLHKQRELQIQIEELVKQKVLSRENVVYYSQVVLTPKPDNAWRFVADYRSLNIATIRSCNWLLPRMKDMIDRILESKPVVYGKLDLTKGYHQIPTGKLMRRLTAIITFLGIFVWERVPMGVADAASYFQFCMATLVLVGLINMILEVYLDDVIIHAQNEYQFLERLEATFQRFREFNIIAHPSKTVLGVPEIDFVGYHLYHDGHTMQVDKLNEVEKIPMPVTVKDMRSFMGYCNFFRDHVIGYSSLAAPLHACYSGQSPKHERIKWTPELTQSFYNLRSAVRNSTKLWYIDDTKPIYLHTDASDFGIGAVLFQLGDEFYDEEQKVLRKHIHPCTVVSTSFSKQQLRWSTREKEAYAIYWSITKLRNHLEGRHFILRTDHQNLLYISEIGSQKVNRWWYELQQFSFDKEHISGTDNNIADMLSRIPRANPCTTQDELVACLQGNEFGMANSRIVRNQVTNVEYLCVILPKEDFNPRIRIAFEKVHNSGNGHWGVDKTIELMKKYKIRDRGHDRLLLNPDTDYKHLHKQVTIMIKQCGICQKLSYIRPAIEARRFTVASHEGPMQVLSVDHITGLPIADLFGYECILVIICLFSRFVELYAVQSPNAEETARCLVQHFGRYGVAERLVSDNGSEFVNETIQHVTKMMNVEHVRTLAYSKQENAIVERSNKEVLRHLRAIVTERLLVQNWWMYLPLVQRAINSSRNDRLGVSPAEIVFGDATRLQKGFTIPISPEEQLDTTTLSISEKQVLNNEEVWSPDEPSDSTAWTVQQYMSRLHFAQRRIIAVARAEQIKIDREHMEENQAKHLIRKVGRARRVCLNES